MKTAEPRLSLEEITPSRAEHYLKRNKANRPVKPGNVLKLKNDLQQGNFKLTHQGIAFDWDGNLIDGQHRLLAIIESGVTVSMYVTYNCDPEIFKVIDSGSTRSANDVVKLLGASNYSTVTAAIRLILWAYDRYAAQNGLHAKKVYKNYTTTNAETAAFYTENTKNLEELATKAKYLRGLDAAITPSAVLGFLFLAKQKYGYEETAYNFMHRIASGAELRSGSVELALSKFIHIRHIDLQGYKKGEFMLMAYIKAFNRYLAGDSLLLFRVGSTDLMPVLAEDSANAW